MRGDVAVRRMWWLDESEDDVSAESLEGVSVCVCIYERCGVKEKKKEARIEIWSTGTVAGGTYTYLYIYTQKRRKGKKSFWAWRFFF